MSRVSCCLIYFLSISMLLCEGSKCKIYDSDSGKYPYPIIEVPSFQEYVYLRPTASFKKISFDIRIRPPIGSSFLTKNQVVITNEDLKVGIFGQDWIRIWVKAYIHTHSFSPDTISIKARLDNGTSFLTDTGYWWRTHNKQSLAIALKGEAQVTLGCIPVHEFQGRYAESSEMQSWKSFYIWSAVILLLVLIVIAMLITLFYLRKKWKTGKRIAEEDAELEEFTVNSHHHMDVFRPESTFMESQFPLAPPPITPPPPYYSTIEKSSNLRKNNGSVKQEWANCGECGGTNWMQKGNKAFTVAASPLKSIIRISEFKSQEKLGPIVYDVPAKPQKNEGNCQAKRPDNVYDRLPARNLGKDVISVSNPLNPLDALKTNSDQQNIQCPDAESYIKSFPLKDSCIYKCNRRPKEQTEDFLGSNSLFLLDQEKSETFPSKFCGKIQDDEYSEDIYENVYEEDLV